MAGPLDARVEPGTDLPRDFGGPAWSSGVVSQSERDEWLGQRQAASASGKVFAALNMFVGGRKPARAADRPTPPTLHLGAIFAGEPVANSQTTTALTLGLPDGV